ncbi:hypothetical protein [Naasia lichenicola]|uniref:Uncharacterized protein n=1 Tax=Naasia lichenicola TaxID=2565933 RepID=A0A4S4FI12_9MICO|nr:hypothetical protein [Naasia lichenicola]THG28706.1 hypothetical protein E6C64_18160 [Naasia lichenicola]
MTEPDDAYEHAIRDPAFRARFAAAYRGEHNALDALWWMVHPLEPSPRGLIAPAALRRDLQRAVYSAKSAEPAGSNGSNAAAESLHALEASIAAERVEVSRALELVDVEDSILDAPSAPDVDGDQGAGGGTEERAFGGRGDVPADELPRRRGAIRRPLLVALLLVGAIAIGASGLLLRPVVDSAFAEPVEAADVAIFDRAQQPSDLPSETAITELAYADIAIDSLRRLSLNPSIAAPEPTNRAYLARDLTDRVCLFVLDDVVAFAMGCVTEEQFRVDGLRVVWTTSERLRLGGDPEDATRSVTVAPNGSVVSTLAPRFPASTGYRSSING